MDYKARLYDPYLNRFTQPDSIIPNLNNPQTLNRYSYVLNNPIRYNDPTGHIAACEKGDNCKEQRRLEKLSPVDIMKQAIHRKFHIKIVDDKMIWSVNNLITAFNALNTIDTKLNGNLKTMVGGTTFTMTDGGSDYFGRTYPTGIVFHVSASYIQIPLINFFHETGHLLNSVPATDNVFSNQIPERPTWVKDGYVDREILGNRFTEPVQAKPMNESYIPKEYWADAFANYMAGNINLAKPAGSDMYNFVSGALP